MAPAPTASEMRAPWTMRLYMSRPMKSAPSQNRLLGGASENLALVAVGSIGAMTSANDRRQDEDGDDERADRAQRIAPGEEQRCGSTSR